MKEDFLEEVHQDVAQGLSLADFSFAKSQKNLAGYKGSLSETVIEERGTAL